MNTVTSIPIKHRADNQLDHPFGYWSGDDRQDFARLSTALCSINKPLYIFKEGDQLRLSQSGQIQIGHYSTPDGGYPLLGFSNPVKLQSLGDPSFCHDQGIQFPYMTGAMANGIASTRLVIAVARAGMLGSFGAAGLSVRQVEEVLIELKQELGSLPYCANLIHSPNETGKEDQIVDLYLKHGLRLVEASAYLALTTAVVRYRVHGIHTDAQGNIITPNRIIAKASRIEVANRWFSPPPEKILKELRNDGVINEEQLNLARQIPMAQDLTVEADSGGHTDNRPAITLIPTMIALRDRLQRQHSYKCPLRVGAAGGIATPTSAAGAFAMGAAYIVTGTINQACIESGSSDLVRKMLSEAQQADIAMAPAVDMFEMGVKLQVLKRGTLFAMRGNKLYEAYRAYNSIEEIPAIEKEQMEKVIFKAPLSDIWNMTKDFFNENDPSQVAKAEQNPKHKMALMFRWYLGLSSRWANAGVTERQTDYQVWCGPAMGAFNEWSQGSFLELPENRGVVVVALNVIFGAAVVVRINTLRNQGLHLPADNTHITPLQLIDIEKYLNE